MTRLRARKSRKRLQSLRDDWGVKVINSSGVNYDRYTGAILALVYEAGQRPGLDALSGLAHKASNFVPFKISHIPGAGANWVELLASGLTFDCRGLAPAEPEKRPGSGVYLGLHDVPEGECLTVGPSPHLAEGGGVLPVVRCLAGIGAEMARLPAIKAVYWYPSQCWMAPKYFAGVMQEWLGGGAFPALGLTSLQRDADGSMKTAGLDYLIGQELRFEPTRKLVPAALAKIAVRLINELVLTGPLRSVADFTGPEGERLRVEPDANARRLKVTIS